MSNPVPRFRRRNGNGKIQTVKGEAWRFFRTREKILLGLDGLDSRNGYKTEIVFGGEICYTWVSKLTNKSELVRTGVYDELDNMA